MRDATLCRSCVSHRDLVRASCGAQCQLLALFKLSEVNLTLCTQSSCVLTFQTGDQNVIHPFGATPSRFLAFGWCFVVACSFLQTDMIGRTVISSSERRRMRTHTLQVKLESGVGDLEYFSFRPTAEIQRVDSYWLTVN